MPQMAPLMWLFLFFYFILLFMMFVMNFYFILCPLTPSLSVNTQVSTNCFEWLW